MQWMRWTAAAAIACSALGASALVNGAEGDSDGSGMSDVIGAFRQPPTGADALPPTAAAEIRDLGPADAQLGRSIKATEDGGWTAYLTPAGDAMCISLTDRSGGSSASCPTRAALLKGLARPAAALTGCEAPSPEVAPTCSDALVYGVVPDGVTSVSADVKSGESPRAAVENNVYLLHVPLAQHPRSIVYEGEQGPVRQPLPF